MALKTNEEMLEITQNAMVVVMQGGQAVNAFGRSVTRADLAELKKEYDYFKGQVEREERGGIRSRRAVPFN